MRHYSIIYLALLFLHIQGEAQTQQSGSIPNQLRVGAGYFGQNLINPGLVLELEYDRYHSREFSLPLRANVGYNLHPDHHTIFLDVHKGFRKFFRSGLFLEQSLGAGLIVKSYRTEMWYHDQYFNSIAHGNSPVIGFKPSVSFGFGYDVSSEKDGSSLLWFRPEFYWDLGFRMLHQPYFALQLGYSHTIETK